MAHHFFKIAANKGSAKAMKELIKINDTNSLEAIYWSEKLAMSQPQKMDSGLFFLLGSHYEKIDDETKAVENYKKAAKLGHDYAIAKLLEAAEELAILPPEESLTWREKLPGELKKLPLNDLFDILEKKYTH